MNLDAFLTWAEKNGVHSWVGDNRVDVWNERGSYQCHNIQELVEKISCLSGQGLHFL